MNQQLALIDRAYMEPLDRSTQVTRFPPVSAPCDCRKDDACEYPFCRPDEGDKDEHGSR